MVQEQLNLPQITTLTQTSQISRVPILLKKKKVKIHVFRETFTKAYNSVHCELLLLDILQMFGSLEYTLLSFFPLSFLTLDKDFTKFNAEALKDNYKRTN